MSEMTSLQRVLTTLGHREPDRVPLFLLVTMHGARELGLSIRDYFSRAENVVEGQLRMRAKYRHDCLYPFFYAAVEVEAFGGEVLYREDGPPNSGGPFIRTFEQIKDLHPVKIGDAACLRKVLRAIELLKASVGDEAPIIGVVMSPFSVPVMQLGFERYLQLIYEQPELFQRLMAVNEEFCVAWANAQLSAGATAIGYFDPISSTTIVPKEMFLNTGLPLARRTLARIKGLVAVHMGSGRCEAIVDDLCQLGAGGLGVSALDDLRRLKAACRGKLTLLGNLNGIAMRHWTATEAEAATREAIAQAGAGGGFILSDNHGEIPWQVPEQVLLRIAAAVDRWGRYPLDWAVESGR